MLSHLSQKILYMKFRLVLLILSLSITGFAQHCDCEHKPRLKEAVSCDIVTFANQAKLYRQYNCDSSWLVFETRTGQKKILYSLEKDFIELTERLGYQYETEYANSFLIRNRVVSGCCQPEDFLLLDKQNGNLIKDFGAILHFTTALKNNMIISFANDALNAINIYDVGTGAQRKVALPKKRLANTMKISGELYPESLVENVEIIDTAAIVCYKYQTRTKESLWLRDTIFVDLRKKTSN